MGKFDGILICTDLDGTLYKNDKTISSENKAAIEYFKSEGGYFTFITGRMPAYSRDAYDKISPNVPFGCINGGGVYDGSASRYVWTCDGVRGAEDMIRCVDEQLPDVGIQIITFDKTYFHKQNDATETFLQITKLPRLTCDYHGFSEPIAKVMFCTKREEEMAELERLLRSHPRADDYTLIRSERILFEILQKGVQKGLALRKLTEYLGIDHKKTVAIGDYYNDIGMFREAGVGVAVANACEGAKQEADYVTVSNEEHAIARVIYDVESGKLSF